MRFTTRRVPRSSGSSEEAIVRRHRPDFLIILFVSILMLLGLVVLYAISPARVELINTLGGHTLDQNHFMYKQVLYLFVGLVAFGVTMSIPFSLWRRFQEKILLLGIGLCVILAILGLAGSPLALCTAGACRWFDFGFASFQPAEVVKFGLVIYLAGFLAARIQKGNLDSLSDTLMPIGIILAIVSVLVIGFQRDMGTGITIFGIVATMLFVAGLSRRYIALALGSALAAGVLLIVTSPHRIERVVTFFSPSHADANRYHIDQALIAIGSGGWLGKGLGRSVQAFGYLPEAVNDSIFAILGEKFGFVGLLAVLAIFAALFMRLLKVMDNVPNAYYRLIVAGVFGWLASHTVVNIGAMLGTFPLTGITLPFLSYGGTSLLFTMCALGLVFHISRYTSHQSYAELTNGGSSYENSRGGRGIGRTRNAGSRRTS